MAFDAQTEDYSRVLLGEMWRNPDVKPQEAEAFYEDFQERYLKDRDSIQQSDADRAFHLVALATDIVDYQIPFATPEEGEELAAEAASLLDEAIKLDSECWDARRMMAMAECTNQEDYYQYLVKNLDKVRASARRQIEDVPMWFQTEGWAGDYTPDFIAVYTIKGPFLRWLGSMCFEALVGGRYSLAIEHHQEIIGHDPVDVGESQLAAMYACAKKGNLALLEEVANGIPAKEGHFMAWRLLASCAAYFRQGEIDAASDELTKLCDLFPEGGDLLYEQDEVIQGAFARPSFSPGTLDELLFAVSEASVLFQEGFDPSGHGIFGEWVRNHPAVQRTRGKSPRSKGKGGAR